MDKKSKFQRFMDYLDEHTLISGLLSFSLVLIFCVVATVVTDALEKIPIINTIMKGIGFRLRVVGWLFTIVLIAACILGNLSDGKK